MFRHLIYRFCKILQHLIYRNTTQSLIFRRHTDVAWLIKVTEHTDLGELGDTCEQYKLQMYRAQNEAYKIEKTKKWDKSMNDRELER